MRQHLAGFDGDGAGYIQHPTHLGIRPGAYTDDTQMTLAVAELLVSSAPWQPAGLAEHFERAYHLDPRGAGRIAAHRRRGAALRGSTGSGHAQHTRRGGGAGGRIGCALLPLPARPDVRTAPLDRCSTRPELGAAVARQGRIEGDG